MSLGALAMITWYVAVHGVVSPARRGRAGASVAAPSPVRSRSWRTSPVTWLPRATRPALIVLAVQAAAVPAAGGRSPVGARRPLASSGGALGRGRGPESGPSRSDAPAPDGVQIGSEDARDEQQQYSAEILPDPQDTHGDGHDTSRWPSATTRSARPTASGHVERRVDGQDPDRREHARAIGEPVARPSAGIWPQIWLTISVSLKPQSQYECQSWPRPLQFDRNGRPFRGRRRHQGWWRWRFTSSSPRASHEASASPTAVSATKADTDAQVA